MNAHVKTLIDRTNAIYPEIGTKDIYFIVTAADTSREALERTIDRFRGFTSCYSSLNERGGSFTGPVQIISGISKEAKLWIGRISWERTSNNQGLEKSLYII
jgi:hypothetical protein